jgi:hypothetical protein
VNYERWGAYHLGFFDDGTSRFAVCLCAVGRTSKFDQFDRLKDRLPYTLDPQIPVIIYSWNPFIPFPTNPPKSCLTTLSSALIPLNPNILLSTSPPNLANHDPLFTTFFYSLNPKTHYHERVERGIVSISSYERSHTKPQQLPQAVNKEATSKLTVLLKSTAHYLHAHQRKQPHCVCKS